MRNKGFVVVLALIITFLCLYYLQFTLVSRNIQQDAISQATNNGSLDLGKKQRYLDSLWNKPVYNFFGIEYSYKEVKENELSLGLDLQGGMHVVLEISPIDILRGLSNSPQDPAFVAALQKAQALQKTSEANFVDLFHRSYSEANPGVKMSALFATASTRGRVSISDSDDEVIKILKAEVEDAISRSFTILKTRIDQFGTSQPNIQRLTGSGRIQIEIPGADNPQRVKKLLQGVARLEFWNVIEISDPSLGRTLDAINNVLLREQPRISNIDPDVSDTSEIADLLKPKNATDSVSSELDKQLQAARDSLGSAIDSLRRSGNSPLISLWTPGIPFLYSIKDTAVINDILKRPDIKSLFPRNIGFYWDVKPDPDITPNVDDLQLNFVDLGRNGKPLLTGEVIVNATQDFDNYGKYCVSMRMSAAGSKVWAKVTKEVAGKGRIAIVLDNYVYTAPNVISEIPNGNSQITGSFSLEESKDLANILKAGSLPAPTRIVEEAIIGPTLGKVAQSQGFISMASGLALLVIFMVAYYSKGGMVANISLLFNNFFILGILAQLDAALTLPGIAGIVLTLGMAVDANVLIFERVKEELRQGRKLRDAIQKGYQRAFSSIFDSNLTTLLTALALYVFGQGPLKGFAITLMVGIATSFFSAVYISRVIIEWMVRRGDEAKVSFSTPISKMMDKTPSIEFIGRRKLAYIFSTLFIAIGMGLIAVQGLNLGVDFKGGRSYIVTFNKPVEATAMKNALGVSFENAGTEVKNYGTSNVIKVTTSYLVEDESDESDDKVKKAMIAGLGKHTGMQFSEDDSKVDDNHFTISSSSKVGATIADDIKGSAFKAGVISILLIFIYILFRFRKWQYSTGAIIALIHDSLFTIAAFAMARTLGFPFEIDQVFVAAILTIIGYSINDTVIIFDRIREFIGFGTFNDRAQLFNAAINQTLSRTIITSGTTLMVVIVLLFFGGEVLRGFSFALLVGFIIGTYSTVFIAAPIVLDFDSQKLPALKP